MNNYIERDIYRDLYKHSNQKQITIITGLRRTGKTTLLKKILEDAKTENKIYIDLERLDNRELFSEKNYDNIVLALKLKGLNFNKKVVIAIDEIQLLPGIVSVIKYLYDNYNIKFIVSGSSSYYIKNYFTESLAGRKKVFTLSTLKFGEFLKFNNVKINLQKNLSINFIPSEYERLKKHYEDFIKYGGFPEVTLERKVKNKTDLLDDIINSYLSIDIKNISEIRDQKNLHLLLKMLAGRVGTRLDYSKLSILTGISRTTVYNYLDLLENTFVVYRLPVFSKSADREIVKAPKIFFQDNGLLNRLAEISSGSQFENAVFNQFKHYGYLQYYSLKTGKEIDFILDKNKTIEVKETATEQNFKNLRNMSLKIGIKKNILVSRFPSPKYTDFLWGGFIL